MGRSKKISRKAERPRPSRRSRRSRSRPSWRNKRSRSRPNRPSRLSRQRRQSRQSRPRRLRPQLPRTQPLLLSIASSLLGPLHKPSQIRPMNRLRIFPFTPKSKATLTPTPPPRAQSVESFRISLLLTFPRSRTQGSSTILWIILMPTTPSKTQTSESQA